MKALSIRQPWAHLILNGGKNIENRTWRTHFRGRFLIHASAKMTRGDYEAAALFCSSLPDGTFPDDFWFPTFEQLRKELGQIVGVATLADCVTASKSPWFTGPYGFVLRDVEATHARVCMGKLQFFETPFFILPKTGADFATHHE